MNTVDESQAASSSWDEVAAERSAIEEELRAVVRGSQLVPIDTTEARQLREEARRLRQDERRLTEEARRNGRTETTKPGALAGITRQLERRRIALQILAVLVPWRDALSFMDPEECDLFRVRGHALLNYLDVAVRPYPDLQDALVAAKRELTLERR